MAMPTAAFSLVDYPTGLHGHPVQLVFIGEHPVENIKRHFDFGLSQCWVTPNQLRMTPAYWRDHLGHRITYLPSAEPNAQRRLSSRQRAERLKLKYPGWAFHGLERLAGVALPESEAWLDDLPQLAQRYARYVPRQYGGRHGL